MGNLHSAVAADELCAIEFGAQGNDTYHLAAGWSEAEDGYRWTVGGRSELWFENPGSLGDCVLELDVSPYDKPPAMAGQRLGIFVRDWLCGRTVLTRECTVRFRVPGVVFAGRGPVRVTFEHPDAKRPCDIGDGDDDRALAVRFRQMRLLRIVPGADLQLDRWHGLVPGEIEGLTGLPPSQLMLQFESLGDNCECGLVQRRCGAEPRGLLRFSNLEPRQLLLALEADFEGIGESENTEVFLSGSARREYVVRDRRYAMVFHTFQYEGDVPEAKLIPQQLARLKFLRRKFLEILAAGDRILVIKRNDPLCDEEIVAIHALLQRHGPNTLLAVVPGDADHVPGTVEKLRPGLLRAYVDRFAPYENAYDFSFEVWLSIFVRAFLLTRPNGTEAS